MNVIGLDNWNKANFFEISEADSTMKVENENQPSFQKNKTHDLTFILPNHCIESDEASLLQQQSPSINSKSPSVKSQNRSSSSKCSPTNQNSHCRIYAHKEKIAEKSDYFRLLLTNGMKESSQQEISIPNIPAPIFYEILLFLYTSELPINLENFVNIFLYCDQFLLEDGKELCRKFIKRLDMGSLYKILFDDECNISTELTNLYLDQMICNGEYFLELERVGKLNLEMLVKILISSDIRMKEIQIFKSCLEWIKVNLKDVDVKQDEKVLCEIFQHIRFPLMDYEEISTIVEPSFVVPSHLLLEAYRHLSKPKYLPLKESDFKNNLRLNPRKKHDFVAVPGCDVFQIQCNDHKKCHSVSWPIENFSVIKSQKHISSTFEMFGLTWRMWAYPAGEAKHADSFSVYLEAVRVKEKESYDFLRNTTFFFALVNQKNKTLSRHYPSSPNVLFNYEKSVWGNGLIELKTLYDTTLGYLDNDCVIVQLHILECIALEG
ncbi:BTB/POZ domain-containing protein [Tieghemostelium lacteum]|uniref:BTB/POZ domain-containing protein n=1 Tax=Tieghemostelium lacteum TaxID=361077 RepID=A0A151Z659_TIELA|nr:BTB/POZ domain-containing protein [Tieghemostelium lacteum]|eukprot:KYQ89446.1 BTB/POZ domain-containing protein [Tieghemostelium lacteum]